MTLNFRGYVFDDAGNAVDGAFVKLLDTGTSNVRTVGVVSISKDRSSIRQ